MTIPVLVLTVGLASQGLSPTAPSEIPRSAYTCRTLSGAVVDLASTRGKAVVMTFVNTECSNCLRVTLRVADVHREVASQERVAFVLIAINNDASAKLERFVQEASVSFPACVDAKASAERFLGIPLAATLLTPTVVFLDGNGVLRDAMPPGDKRLASPATIREALDRVLKGTPSGSSAAR